MKVCYILAIMLLVFSLGVVSATSLELTSGTTSLGGNLTYDSVIIHPGATLSVNSTGYLNITALNYIYVYGTITSNGAGSSGGARAQYVSDGNVGAGTGGGKGGEYYDNHGDAVLGSGGGGASQNVSGGAGGHAERDAGTDFIGDAGTTWGTATAYMILTGSGGGSGGTTTDYTYYFGGKGGNGGGAIVLKSPVIVINGTINTDGIDGEEGNVGATSPGASGGGGGGGAGNIILQAITMNLSGATLTASGGDGGYGEYGRTYSSYYDFCGTGGGGGAGGSIILAYKTSFINASVITTAGGIGGASSYYDSPKSCDNGNNGTLGLITYVVDASMDLNTIPSITINSPVDFTNSTTTANVFSLTGTDEINLTKLELYGNFTGSWTLNQTNLTPVNNTAWNTTLNLPDGMYLFQGCAYNNNSQSSCSENYTLTVDTVGPSITLPLYANLTQKINTSTLQIEAFISDSFSGITNSHCFVEANGTNTTSAISNGWCNITIPLTGLADGTHVINVYANDSFGNIALNNSYFIVTVSDKPAIEIISPFGVQSSTNVSFNFSIGTFGTLSYCSYNVTTQPGVVVVPENEINCSQLLEYQIIGDTGGVDYILNVFANDTLGNSNHFTGYFSVSLTGTTPEIPGGGGGSISQPDELTFGKTESICTQFKTTFAEAVATSRTQDKIIDKLKTIWISFWDYVLCSSTASIYPI